MRPMSERDRKPPESGERDHQTFVPGPLSDGTLGWMIERFGAAGAQRIIQREMARRRAGAAPATIEGVQAAAAHALSGSDGPVPHREAIAKAVAPHDIDSIRAHSDERANEGTSAMDAKGVATRGRVAFAEPPSLHTAAHEVAHVLQQRGGVQLDSGVGQQGDAHEQHADAVADRVVRGESATDLLPPPSASPATSEATGVQRVINKADGHPYSGLPAIKGALTREGH